MLSTLKSIAGCRNDKSDKKSEKVRFILEKKILLSFVAMITIALSSFGQAPEGFKYQAVVRNAGNVILNNQAVGMRLVIQQGAIGGLAVYTETFATTSNAYGLVNLEIGTGTTTDDFSTIDWTNGPYFMETAVDLSGGTSYTVMGTSQLMSVPYALYAKTSGSSIPGPQGVPGNDGATGPQGIQGIPGNDGATGPQGPAGVLASGTAAGNTTFWDGSTWVLDNNNLYNYGDAIGIGTGTPDLSAKMDIVSSNTGLLIPRIALTTLSSASPVSSPANSLLVYNTATVADVLPGFYYWSSASAAWIRIAEENAGWNILGNTGTIDGTNFIGTIDNVPLNIKVGNQKAGRIDPIGLNTFLGYYSGNSIAGGGNNSAYGAYSLQNNTSGTNNNSFGYYSLYSNVSGGFNTAIGNNALYSNTASNNIAIGHNAMDVNSTGTPNLAIGVNALGANTTGTNNLAIGHHGLLLNIASNNLAIGPRALDANTVGSSNLAIGADALGANGSGSNNAAVGYNTLLISTGSYNVALGSSAGNGNSTGTNNTFIGYNTDASAGNLNNATAIGANAVVSSSNSVVLGNNANVGIGTSNPFNGKLQVVGNAVLSATNAPFDATTRAVYIRGTDGFSTATTPSYSWYNSDQTGIFHPSTGVIGFSVNGYGEAMRILNNRLGIGTTAPNGQLELSLDQGRKPGTNTWTVVSDERLKTIHGSYDKGIAELMKLQTITYQYKNVGDRKFDPQVLQSEYVGFSAQEVQKVFPEAVGTDEDGYLNLNIHPILVAYLNAIKEQQVMLQSQQEMIENQQQLLMEMRRELDSLKEQ